MKNTKKNTKKNTNNWFDKVDLLDSCLVRGYVKKVIFESDNVTKWCVETASHTQNGKIRRAWITVVDFDGLLEEGNVYDMDLIITTNNYKDNFTTEFVVNEVNEI